MTGNMAFSAHYEWGTGKFMNRHLLAWQLLSRESETAARQSQYITKLFCRFFLYVVEQIPDLLTALSKPDPG